MRRMVKFAEAFPEVAIVSTLSTKLSWSHMVAIVAIKNTKAHQFYANQAAQDSWSVRELHHQIERKAFERTELAGSQAPANVENKNPALVFKDRGCGVFLKPFLTKTLQKSKRLFGVASPWINN
jgi:hypothetical protein